MPTPSPRPIVTVLRCDFVPEPDRTNHGDAHERMLVHLAEAAERAGLDIELRWIDVYNGELPADDDPSALFVTTGSATNPDSEEPWVEALRGWMRRAVAARRPVYGVCFGHQLLAHALGGETRRHPGGWEVGRVEMAHRFTLPPGGAATDALPAADDQGADQVSLLMSHQDEVSALPEVAVPWLVGDFCTHQGYVIPGVAAAVQGHPEYAGPQVADLYARRRHILGDAMADSATESARSPHSGVDLTVEVLRYFLG